MRIYEKNTYKSYIGLDSCMANLMRPALYGAYHHITVLWKENEKEKEVVDVTGSLCENNDKFAIDRKLPKIGVWDLLVIHDVWAHGHAMWFNYNAKLRPAELLWDSKTWKIIFYGTFQKRKIYERCYKRLGKENSGFFLWK